MKRYFPISMKLFVEEKTLDRGSLDIVEFHTNTERVQFHREFISFDNDENLLVNNFKNRIF